MLITNKSNIRSIENEGEFQYVTPWQMVWLFYGA